MGVGILLATLTLQSCLDDDNKTNFTFMVTPIDSINMPDSADLGKIVEITTYTQIKDQCQTFYSFDYTGMNNERTVSTVIMQNTDVNCGELKTIKPVLKFRPQDAGDYTFRFWAGKDSVTNKNIFITRDIHIKHSR